MMAMRVEHGVSDARGARNHMEDRHLIVEDLLTLRDGKNESNTKWGLYGVFDGHGGDVCSEWITTHLDKNIIAEKTFPDDIPAAMEAGLRKTDEEFKENHPKLLDDGSTAVFAIVQIIDDIPKSIWVANSGDSRSILIKSKNSEFSAKPLSVDHKPGSESERARIEASGGIVKQGNFFGLRGPDRVYDSKNRGGLAISRGVGDLFLKRDNLVIVDPDIVQQDVKPSCIGFVVGSDGLYDVYENEKIAEMTGQMLHERLSPQEIAARMVMRVCKDGGNLCDNVTVIFVCFQNPFAEETAE